MTDTQERLYTSADLPQLPDNGKHYELLRGELIEMSPTSAVHGVIAARLLFLISAHIYATRAGQVFAAETGFKLSTNPDTVLAPDIAYVSAERAKPLTDKFASIAPDLAVEVVSPGNSASELNQKIALYFQAGTQQVWIVYPKTRTIHIYSAPNQIVVLSREDELDGGNVLPGFKLPLETLFSVLDT